MKYVTTKANNSITINKVYEIGEKFIQALLWKESDGIISKEAVETKVPGATYIGVKTRTMFSPLLENITCKYVMIERVFN